MEPHTSHDSPEPDAYAPPALVDLGSFGALTRHDWLPGAPGKLHGRSDGIGFGSQSRLHHTSA